VLQNIVKLNELVSTVANATSSPPAPPSPAGFLEALQAQLNAFAKHIKEDEELALFSTIGQDRMRVFDVEFTPPAAAILHGVDSDNNRTTALVHLESVQFVCKVQKLKVPGKPRPVGFRLGKK
jgi:hypothetical protein